MSKPLHRCAKSVFRQLYYHRKYLGTIYWYEFFMILCFECQNESAGQVLGAGLDIFYTKNNYATMHSSQQILEYQ